MADRRVASTIGFYFMFQFVQTQKGRDALVVNTNANTPFVNVRLLNNKHEALCENSDDFNCNIFLKVFIRSSPDIR